MGNRISYQFSNVVHAIQNLKHIRPYAIHGVVVVMIFSAVTLSGQMTDYTEQNASRIIKASQSRTTSEATSAYVAANVADGVSPALAQQVTSDTESLNQRQGLMAANADQLSKVSTVSTESISRDDITKYTVKEGDSVSSIAKEFNVTTKTVRWVNDLTEQEMVQAGDTLTILPIDGVLHTVASGDTPEKLADTYQSNARQIVSINDAEVGGLPEGKDIIIPDGVLPESERPSYSPAPASVNNYIASSFLDTTSPGRLTFIRRSNKISGGDNRHYGGQCTWYVAERKNIYGESWGHATQWLASAKQRGIPYGSDPREGAIAQTPNAAFGLGHVGIVEKVLDNGKVRVRSMNMRGAWNIHDEVVPASKYNYIYY